MLRGRTQRGEWIEILGARLFRYLRDCFGERGITVVLRRIKLMINQFIISAVVADLEANGRLRRAIERLTTGL